MSLRVWLPLDGDLRQLGISELACTENTGVISNAGKIGSCYTFTNQKITLTATSNFNAHFSTQCSLALWVKISSSHNSWAQVLTYGKVSTSWTAIICGLDINSSGKVYFNCTDCSTYKQCVSTNAIKDDKWHHLVGTYNNGIIKLYIDGVLDKTTTDCPVPKWSDCTIIGIGGNSSEVLKTGDSLNDVRIYDHCLSTAEVKEIAQGLILHYKLDGGLFGNSNLYTGSEKFTGTWVNSSAWSTESEAYQNFVVKRKSTTWGGLAQNITCTQGDIFTISFYGKIDSGGNIQSVHRSNLGNVTTGLTILGGNFSSGFIWVNNSEDGTQWKRYWATVQITGSDVTYLQWRLENSVADKNFYICGIKLEKGNTATTWCPADSEMNIDRTIIEDSSGYGHNGTINGTLTLSNDTPRYSACAVFNGTNTRIKVPNLTPDAITVSFWMKRNANTGTRQFLYTSWSGVTCELTTSGTTTFAVNKSSYPTISGSTITTSTGWIHYCGTFDTTNGLRLYENGVLKSSNTSNLNAISWNISTNYIGYYNTYYNGLMSDFRIYCTPLLDTDIKQLYNVGMKVDKKQNVHAFEFNENAGRTQFLKTGVIKSAQVADNLLFDNKAHIGKHSYENILPNNVNIVTTKNGHINNSNTLASIPAATMQSLAGKTLRFVYDVKADGIRSSAENNQTAWNYIRYGIHATFQYTNASGTAGTSYPFAGYLTYSGAAKHTEQAWTIPTGYQSYGALGFSIQTFDKPASTNNETWFIQNVRLEIVDNNTNNGYVTGIQIIER